MTREFQLVRLESGPDRGLVALCSGDVTLGVVGRRFELRKLKSGDIGVYSGGELIGTIDDHSAKLVNWPMESPDDTKDDKDDDKRLGGSPKHAAKIKEHHLTLTEFKQGMSIGDVCEQFGFKAANDGTFVRQGEEIGTDMAERSPMIRPGVDVIKPLAGGAWEHRPASDTLNVVRGRTPAELFDHLEFISADYHDGRQLSLFLRRHLHLVEHLPEELGAAVIRYMFASGCNYVEALREVTTQRPKLWERHVDQQTILLID